MESSTVPLKWAQHKKVVFVTLEAKNLAQEGRVITLSPEGALHFSGTNKVTSAHYLLDLNLFDEVTVEETKWKVTDFSVQFSISKKNPESAFWPRITKEKQKFNNITIDWTRWVDEDEADEKNMADYNPDEFQNLPGGYGNEEDDEDDEEYPEDADLGDLDGDFPLHPAEKEEKPEEKPEKVEAKTETEEEKKD